MNERIHVCFPLLLVVLAGCGQELQTEHGRRQGPGADASVNGTAVLADLFQRAGHKVNTTRHLSSRLEDRADCIVWFPDDVAPPEKDVRAWLESWLASKPGRTLIYVGRDFDAACWYWDTVRPSVPAKQKQAFQSRRSDARTAWNSRRQAILPSEDCGWFSVENKRPARSVRTLSGRDDWVADVDPKKLDVELASRFLPAKSATVLLQSEGDMLVSRETLGQGQLLVVTNGSFLLNLPLVNHEHRKLAGKLIATVGPAPQKVVFLESGLKGPPISENDPTSKGASGLAIFHVWPTNWILFHVIVVGVLFCAWRFPIFGPPREPEPLGQSDFGRHLDALARLLAHAGDASYAQTRLVHYRQIAGAMSSLSGGEKTDGQS